MASACALAISSGSIIFIFANQQNLRALLVCFFTGKVVTVHCIFCGDYAFYLWDSFCEKNGLETTAVVSKPQYQINLPLLMARAHAEAISNHRSLQQQKLPLTE